MGLGVCLGVTVGAAALLAKLVDSETIPWENIGYGVMVLLLLASFLGALTAYGKIKRQRLMVCLMTGGGYFAVLLAMTALFFGGQYDSVGVTFLLILAGSGTAGLLGLRQGRGEKKRRMSHR